jgi:hypothetical protein
MSRDLAGKVFNRLTIIKQVYGKKSLCQCVCGTVKLVDTWAVTKGHTKSCGCHKREQEATGAINLKHGQSRIGRRTPEYRTWCQMMTRCENPNSDRYPYYGGRGIRICERWHSFENFFTDMGPKPTLKHSIGRIDNNGDYCKENCRWETQVEQCRNTRRTRFVTANGVTRPISEWADLLGTNGDVLRSRLNKGWSPERTVSERVNK